MRTDKIYGFGEKDGYNGDFLRNPTKRKYSNCGESSTYSSTQLCVLERKVVFWGACGFLKDTMSTWEKLQQFTEVISTGEHHLIAEKESL